MNAKANIIIGNVGEIRFDSKGVDEIVIVNPENKKCSLHLEKLSKSQFWIAIYDGENQYVINLSSKSPIRAEIDEEF